MLSAIYNQLLTVVWDVDPILIHFGEGGIRWYGLLWLAMGYRNLSLLSHSS